MRERLTIAVYHNLHSGGAKRTMDEIVQRLAARHVVDLYAPAPAEVAPETRRAVRCVYTLPFSPAPSLSRPFGRLNYALKLLELQRLVHLQRELARTIDNRGYDVVHVHPCQVTQSPSLLIELRTPSLYYCQETRRTAYEPPVPRAYAERTGFNRLLDRLDPSASILARRCTTLDRAAVHAATRIVTNSKFTRDAIWRVYGVDSDVCYHGIDATRFHPAPVARNGGILSVGALTPRKGFELIVRGIGLLPEAIRPPLTIISNYQEPRERAHIERLAAANHVSLTCLQAVTDDVLIEHYRRARIVAYTPIREPFGLVPLEAMACETPVIGIAEGGPCESIETGRNGILIDRDPQRFADAAACLLGDPEFAAACGAEGRRLVLSQWTWTASLATLAWHLEACANSPHATGGDT